MRVRLKMLRRVALLILWIWSGEINQGCGCSHEPCCYLHECRGPWCCDPWLRKDVA